MNEPRSIHAAEDWGVVLQSVPAKNRKGIVKRLGEIFGLDKHDAEQILANMPLILVDNLSFGLAARIKKFFQTVGAVAETTNHDMIKKNCFQVMWPQTPDLSFFLKNETGPTEPPAAEKKGGSRPSDVPPVVVPSAIPDMNPESPKVHEVPPPPRASHEAPRVIPQHPPVPPKPVQEPPAVIPHQPPVAERPMQESPKVVHQHPVVSEPPAQEPPKVVPEHPAVPPKPVHQPPVFVPQYPLDSEKPGQGAPMSAFQPYSLPEEKPASPASSSIDSDWERRAKELNEKLRKFHEEKKELHVQHTEAAEKAKNDFKQRIEQEKQRAHEIARKAQEDLQREAEKHEALSREGEEWRSKASSLDERARELESRLAEKTSELELLNQQKEDLARQLESAAAETQKEIAALRNQEAETQQTLSAFRTRDAETQQEIATLRSREQELSQKIGGLERNIHEMTESLRSRDDMLAQFEKQILEFTEKAHGFELLRQEHAQLSAERASIREEYDAKFAEQEVRLAKEAEEHRRYRSRMDRKNAAATRELGEWIRGLDTLRQGLQKLILFLGSDSAVLDNEKKTNLRSPLTRGPDSPNQAKS